MNYVFLPIDIDYFSSEKIRKLRESKKMTQQTLSELCKVDIRTIQRVEAGEYGTGLPIFFFIADAFEMTPSSLINLTDTDNY